MSELKSQAELAYEKALQRRQLTNPYTSPLITNKADADVAMSAMRRAANKKGVGLDSLPVPEKAAIERNIKRRAQTGAIMDSVFETFHSPFRTRYTIEQPTERKELNDWYRYYYKREPMVGTAIDLHVEFPLSFFEVEHEDREVEAFFNEQLQECDIFDLIVNMTREYLVVGESFPFGFFDNAENPSRWEGFVLLDPNFIKINTHRLVQGRHNYQIRLAMDDDIKKIVNNGPNDQATGELYKKLPSEVIQAVRGGKDLELNPIQISHFKRVGNAFNVRGESLIARLLDTLMYRDKLRDAQFAIADRHITPKEFYFVGSEEQPADELEIQNFQSALAQQWTNPNQAIVWHHAVRVQWEGASGRVLPLQGEFDQIERWLLAGLGISRVFMDGTGPTFANASIAMDAMIARYVTLRHKLEDWLANSFFRPLCEIHEIYTPLDKQVRHRFGPTQRKNIPWLPNVKWVKSNLRDDISRIQLLEKMYDKGLIASRRLLRAANIDPNIAEQELEDEKKDKVNKQIHDEQQGLPTGLSEAPLETPFYEGDLPEETLSEGGEIGPESPLEGGPETMPPEATREVELPVGM